MVRISNPGDGAQRSGLLRRLFAMVYDSVVVTGLLLIAAAVASPFDQGNQQAFRDPFFTLYLLAVCFFYFALCWKHGGMTVGMRAWKIRLQPEQGDGISWKLCTVRFITALFSIMVLGLGFFWALFDAQNRCWHDITSGSGLYRI